MIIHSTLAAFCSLLFAFGCVTSVFFLLFLKCFAFGGTIFFHSLLIVIGRRPPITTQLFSWAACLALGIKLARGGWAAGGAAAALTLPSGGLARLLAIVPLAMANTYAGYEK
jgi:hypothetical protein